MSSRRIAKKAGTSTMAVYTHFGSMSGLVREMVHEGFGRLAAAFERIEWSADPVADMALIGRVYRMIANANAHLYSVMFGDRSLAGFELTEEDRQYGRGNLLHVRQCAARCIDAGRFRPGDPSLVAHHMWLATHGTVALELGGYLIDHYDADTCFESQLVTLMVGAGDDIEAARSSVLASVPPFERICGAGGSGRAGALGALGALGVHGNGFDGQPGRAERAPGEGG